MSSMKTIRRLLATWAVWAVMTQFANAQANPGMIRFSGALISVAEQERRVLLEVGVYNARMTVELDEHATVTGSLGGRVSARSLVPGLFIEVQGFFSRDGRIRAQEIEIKVQSGAIRMTGRIDNINQTERGQSIFVNGAEFKIDDRTVTVVMNNGIGVTGTTADLAIGNNVDMTGTYLSEDGSGPATSALFHADRIIVSRTFRIQGVIRSRAPVTGVPSIILVHGIVVTLTPETSISSNGMNDRNEAFMPRSTPLIRPIEDDAGDPCRNTPQDPSCPDKPPSDPGAAGELQLGSYVRVEGIIEDTGFTSRYTARAVQVEKPQQIRFQGIVESRTGNSLTVRFNDNVRTSVALNEATQMEGAVTTGSFVEITGQFEPVNLSLVARRIKTLP